MSDLLLDREGELERIGAGVARVREGGSWFAVVYGPAGVGKTRLLAEAGRRAGAAGLRVLTARGSELEREYASGLVRQLFESLLRSASPEERERWLGGAADAAGATLGLKDVAQDQAPGEFAMLHALFWLTSNLCHDGPLALLMDDLHWADEPSLRFLTYLLPRLEDLRLLVVASMRPEEPMAATQLLDLLLSDRQVQTLLPPPLSVAATAQALRAWLGRDDVDAVFVRACHQATGGNPLLLSELARALVAEAVEPAADTVTQVERLGSAAMARWVAVELRRLEPGAMHLAQAAAVLGPGAGLAPAAALAGLDVESAGRHAAALRAAHLLRPAADGPPDGELDYVHPLVRATVYRGIDPGRQAALHRRAAGLLLNGGARLEQVAAHLLHLPPTGDQETVDVLRRAAAQAMASGAAEAALAYLRRAAAEPPDAPDRAAVLAEAGAAAFLIDGPAAIGYLDAATELAEDPVDRARLAGMCETAHLLGKDADHAVAGLTRALDGLPDGHDDLRRGLEAILLSVALLTPGVDEVRARLPELRNLPPADSPGAASLDGVIAMCDALTGDRGCLERARRVLTGTAVRRAPAHTAFLLSSACFVLFAADPDDGITVCDALMAHARATGSALSLGSLYAYRGWGWLLHGALVDAESDLRESLRLMTTIRVPLVRPTALANLAAALLEQGRVREAGAVLDEAGPQDPERDTGPVGDVLVARAAVSSAQGHHEQALETVLAAGRRAAAVGSTNPAITPWRYLAATSLHALGRTSEARRYADENLTLARQWGAPYTLGRGLRLTGLLTPGPAGIDALREAVDTLEGSSARLEHAKALIDLGSALRRANARSEARPALTRGLELALQCGAMPLVAHARTELQASGTRIRSPRMTGPESLTPSEARVADLATQGLTNRQIAQRLYVTVKTVEVHLSAAYRKLGITRRTQLSAARTGTG
ncbi:AAA family ATPase [Streptomyces echinatus]|uniref:AAA family ATPase n=1 Tax=Streptomyces echinatus TaxID=67293 RepID=UPI00378C42A4